MAKTKNKVELMGFLGSDVEIKQLASGNIVGNVSLATNEGYMDKNTSERVDQTEWHRLVIYGKLAELFSQYTHKGSFVMIEGKLKTRQWLDEHEVRHYLTEIVVLEVYFLDKKDNNQNKPSTLKNESVKTKKDLISNAKNPLRTNFDDFDDDIPF